MDTNYMAEIRGLMNRAFEAKSYRISQGATSGLVFPIATADLLMEEGAVEGEIAIALMSDAAGKVSRRVGFFYGNNRFMDLSLKTDPEIEGGVYLERDTTKRFKGRTAVDGELECIIGSSFQTSMALRAVSPGIPIQMTLRQVVAQAIKLLKSVDYQQTLRSRYKGSDDNNLQVGMLEAA